MSVGNKLDAVKNAEVAVLVVDDRAEDLLAVGCILDDPFYELVTATSGREALKRVLDRDFAVILLDVNLPDMDGFELAAMIKQRERSRLTPIIFLTAMSADVGVLYRGYSVGAVDYLTKPIDADVLRAKVSIFAELHRKDLRIKQQAEALIEADRRARDRQVADILRASEKRYRDLAEAIPPIVFTTGPDGEVRYFNRRWYDYTGQSREQAEGWRWTTALHPDDQRDREEPWRQAISSSAPLETECRIRGRDGSYRWHLCRAVPERGPGGEVIGWLGTYTDYDDLKRAHSAAESALQRLEILAEAGAAMSSTLEDRENLERVARLVTPRVADWCVIELVVEGNEDALTVVHAEPSVEARLNRLRELRPPGLLAGGALCEVLATGRPELIRMTTADVLRALAQDEEHATLLSELGLASVMSVPISARGRVLGAMTLVSSAAPRHYDDTDLAMAIDLGHRIGVTIDGARLYREAQNAVALRDEFLSIASHELRTPLTSLLLQQQTLARQMTSNKAPAPQLEKLDKAVKQTRRLEKLIDHLLDVSRVITGKLALEREDMDLVETVRDVAERFSEEAQRAGCRIELGGNGSTLVGCWDRLRLEQVITNLLSNAVRYAPGAPIEVRVAPATLGARLEVIDHGPGIEPDHLGRIFGRFEKGAASSQHGGLGLGLYITRHVVEAHGGTIAVASQVGQGTRFTVELPLLVRAD